jgi:solute carrier family 25 (mitochondrial carnitine/acylcarnitine transporter), member 20/29
MTEFTAGCISGLAQNIIGHPLDTIKIMIQNNKTVKLKTPYNIFSKKYYKGFLYPTTLSILLNGISFQTNHLLNKNSKNHFINGFYTGLLTSPIVYLFEVGKVKKQMKKQLNLKSFFTTPGLFMTICRESIAMSAYFGTYYTLTEKKYSPLFSGGVAGLVNWTLTYQIDVIKNRQMTYNINIRESIKMGNLWKGYGICAIRGIIVNSIGFYVYETSKLKLLN